MRKLAILVLLTCCVGGLRAQSTSSVVGTWRLVSWVKSDPNGGTQPKWDDHPSGLIVYTADGNMSAQLDDSRRPKLGGPWDQASAPAARTAFVGLATYFGRYTIDATANTVTHIVEGAMAQDLIGSRLVRGYRFRGPDRLELRVIANGEGLPAPGGEVLVWERVRR